MVLFAALLTACGSAGPVGSARYDTAARPLVPIVGAAIPAGDTNYANADLAEVFVRLTHDLEWGGRRPALVRFPGPVSVGLRGIGSDAYARFLDRFLSDLSNRTGIEIARGLEPQDVIIRFVPGADFRARVPQHLCIVAPGRLDWPSFRQAPEEYGTRAYETTSEPGSVTVFIPDTLPPYLIRGCLVEEVVQALGPANDLDGLGSSIFSDDGIHLRPTRLDVLMLKLLYSREMRPGLDRRSTRRTALTLLDRLNPGGKDGRALPLSPDRDWRKWSDLMADAFDRRLSLKIRQERARIAASEAGRRAPRGIRHCRSLMAVARLSQDQQAAVEAALSAAETACSQAHGADDLRLAFIRLARARAAHQSGKSRDALALLATVETSLAAHAQEERLTALFALQAAALDAIQEPAAAARSRRLAVAWGSHALGRNHPDVVRMGNK